MSDNKAAANRYLTFHLGPSRYGIPLLSVRQVLELGELTSIPQAPPYFRGLMNLRGQIISVLNLRSKLEVKAPEAKEKETIVVLDLDSELNLAFTVDRLAGVVEIRAEDVGPPPPMLGERTNLLTGVARLNEELILIVDVARTLSLQDLTIVTDKTAA